MLAGISFLQWRFTEMSATATAFDQNGSLINAGRWGWTLEDRPSKMLREIQKQYPALFSGQLTHFFCWQGGCFTHYPNSFPPNNSLELLKSIHALPPYLVQTQKINFGDDMKLLEAFPEDFTMARTPEFFHALRKIIPNDLENHAFLLMEKGNTEILVYENGDLKLHTTYTSGYISDLEYFLLLALEQLKIKALQTTLWVGGPEATLPEINDAFSRFVKTVQPLSGNVVIDEALGKMGLQQEHVFIEKMIYAHHKR